MDKPSVSDQSTNYPKQKLIEVPDSSVIIRPQSIAVDWKNRIARALKARDEAIKATGGKMVVANTNWPIVFHHR